MSPLQRHLMLPDLQEYATLLAANSSYPQALKLLRHLLQRRMSPAR